MRHLLFSASKLAVLVLLFVAPVFSFAKPKVESSVTFPPTSQVGDHQLVLNGTGTRKATFFKVKVYAAAYYASKVSSQAQDHIDAKNPSRLMMIFLRDVTAKKLKDAWRNGITQNNPDSIDSLNSSLEKLNALMKDVSAGDRFTFTFHPEKGVEAQIGRANTLLIKDTQFAKALLKVWFGEHPPNKALKIGLLGEG